jgi:hypothetical protein
MRRLNSDRYEAGLQPPFAPFTPPNVSPILRLESDLTSHRRFLVPIGQARRWFSSAAVFGNNNLRRLCPYADLLGDTYDIRKGPTLKALPELCSIAVSGIRDHEPVREAPATSLVDEIDCQFPLRLEDDILGNSSFFPPFPVISPTLGQIQSPPEHSAPLLANMVKADGNLTVRGLAQRAGILPFDPYRSFSFLGEASVVDDPHGVGFEFRCHPVAEPFPHRLPLPWTLADELLHGLNVSFRHPTCHRFYGLSLAIE